MSVPGSASEAQGSRSGGFRGAGRLAQKITLTLGSNGVGSLLGFVALIAVGRYYAPGAYGAYIFAVSFIGLFGNIFEAGFKQAHQREIAQGLDERRALGVYTRIRVAMGLVMVLLVVGGLLLWTRLLGGGFTDATNLRIVLIILLSYILASGRRIVTDTWLGQGRVGRVEAANSLDSLVYAGTVGLIGIGLGSARGRWVPFPDLGAWIADAMALPAQADTLSLAAYVALGHFAGKVAGLLLVSAWWLRDGTRIGPWDPELAGRYRRFALPVALTVVMALLLQHIDVLMLGYFWTPREVGWYGAAQRIANIAILANIALRGLLMPYFAHLFAQGDGEERAMHAFRQVERFLLLAVLPLALSMIVWARQGLHIFVGDSFLGAAPALAWLAAWAVIMAMNMPVRTKHMAAGHTEILVRVATINLSANIVLNLVLIPTSILGVPLAGMGATGAAAATFASSTLAYAVNRWSAYRTFQIPLFDAAQARMLGAGAALGGFWWALERLLPASATDRFWELALVGLVGAAFFFLVLVLVRGVRREDLRLLRQATSPGRLVQEMRGRP